jgi:hypothetical protein
MFWVSGSGIRDMGYRVLVKGLRCKVRALGIRIWGKGIRVKG